MNRKATRTKQERHEYYVRNRKRAIVLARAWRRKNVERPKREAAAEALKNLASAREELCAF